MTTIEKMNVETIKNETAPKAKRTRRFTPNLELHFGHADIDEITTITYRELSRLTPNQLIQLQSNGYPEGEIEEEALKYLCGKKISKKVALDYMYSEMKMNDPHNMPVDLLKKKASNSIEGVYFNVYGFYFMQHFKDSGLNMDIQKIKSYDDYQSVMNKARSMIEEEFGPFYYCHGDKLYWD